MRTSGFAIWITGAPAAGKTTIAHQVLALLKEETVHAIYLESDQLRAILTPRPTYEPQERDHFYAVLADLAALLAGQDFPLLVDATAPRRAHRERARGQIQRFFEVFVQTPRKIREARDPKGLYRLAREGGAPHLPGASQPYEEPEKADLTVDGEADPKETARQVLHALRQRGWL